MELVDKVVTKLVQDYVNSPKGQETIQQVADRSNEEWLAQQGQSRSADDDHTPGHG